jgi:hypothetical protein
MRNSSGPSIQISTPRVLHRLGEFRPQLIGFEKRLAAEYLATIDLDPVICYAAAPEA